MTKLSEEYLNQKIFTGDQLTDEDCESLLKTYGLIREIEGKIEALGSIKVPFLTQIEILLQLEKLQQQLTTIRKEAGL